MADLIEIMDLIEWLAGVEHRAEVFYLKSSVRFESDTRLAAFLQRLSRDESWHYSAMLRAARLARTKGAELWSAVTLDRCTADNINEAFDEAERRVSDGNLTLEDLATALVKIEFFECNDIFLYILDLLKMEGKEFQHAASKMEDHKRSVENFLSTVEWGKSQLDALAKLAPLWEKSVLIVEDNPTIAAFLVKILGKKCSVQVAENGLEGLNKVQNSYFDAIVSDVDMPIMNGIEFYNKAVEGDRAIGRNFLFFTAAPLPERVEFFRQNGLTYLEKPASIKQIGQAVGELVSQSTVN